MAFPILKKKDYKPVLFDGLNVYYVAQERSELSAFFKTPASVFDEYTLYKYSRDMESLRVQFVSSEKDRKARLKVIEEQGKRVGELEEEVHRRLKEIKGLYEERDKLGQQSQALAQELESLRSQFVSSEKDREARGRVIEEQGKQVGELEEKTLHQKEELIRISQKLIQISDESVSILAKIKIILIVANPLIAFVGRQLLKDLEAKLVEGKKVMKFS
jgi:chromosome segregation ATPase